MANYAQILSETQKSYDNSRNALQNQINAVSSDLATTKSNLQAQYDQGIKTLENQRNQASSAASMNAGRNGGSFGGSTQIANDKYYQQTFTPAITQAQTNLATNTADAEKQANQTKLSLEQTLAQLNDEASKTALQRYDAAVQAEREEAYRKQQLALQRQQIAAQNAAMAYLNQGGTQAKTGYTVTKDSSGGLQFANAATGNSVRFATYYSANGGNWTRNDLLSALASTFGKNSTEYNAVAKLPSYVQFTSNTGKNFKSTGVSLFDRLGITLKG